MTTGRAFAFAGLFLVVCMLFGVLTATFGAWGWAVLGVVLTGGVAYRWRHNGTAGLVRIAVALSCAAPWVISGFVSDSVGVLWVTGGLWVLGVTLLPDLAVKRYEQRQSRASPSH